MEPRNERIDDARYVRALRAVFADLCVALVGPARAGKSALLHALTGGAPAPYRPTRRFEAYGYRVPGREVDVGVWDIPAAGWAKWLPMADAVVVVHRGGWDPAAADAAEAAAAVPGVGARRGVARRVFHVINCAAGEAPAAPAPAGVGHAVVDAASPNAAAALIADIARLLAG